MGALRVLCPLRKREYVISEYFDKIDNHRNHRKTVCLKKVMRNSLLIENFIGTISGKSINITGIYHW